MSLAQFKTPQLQAVKGDVLRLSGQALLVLMEAVLAKKVPFRFCARGWSMSPFIRDGDVITVSPFLGKMPGIGEVLAFVHPEMEKLVVHRTVARYRDAFLMQGDNVGEHSDGLVPIKNLLGRVTHIERNNKAVFLGLGVERYLIAWLSRVRVLIPMRGWLACCRSRFSGKNG